ncbi:MULTISPECIES: hypothetical protein [unclassified Polaribacter]|uniref:hypothetical protein n=1 Tax=unclassified Polaribacter TaxID=196858 RepID=UPI0011BE2EEA|nr:MULTISPECIES: hypothetical protein [unclassified Polaribacter]TXD50762.1 hypothetical protein ES043_14765 [Polaribacter sp. IC063]TXD57454.1 hypothetical protein ES044_15005 [Polaribacter sp. IC066]
MNKNKQKKSFYLAFTFSFFLFFCGCDLDEIGISESNSEDSGFQLWVNNYSENQYNECGFYFGYTDIDNNFIKTDSMVYKDIVIYKKGDGPHYNIENGFSKTYPSSQNSKGLNKYGVWEPNEKTKKLYFNSIGISLKIEINGNELISNSNHGLNGSLSFRILENGEISW